VSGVQAKKVLVYMTLPGVVPRLRAIFTRGFGQVAFLMAWVYNMVRLIPHGHPYLQVENTGRFGIRHVIAEAANNLVISRRNIDQIIIFFVVLMGVALIFLQFFLLAYGFVIKPAMAVPIPDTMTSLFTTPAPLTTGPSTDVAFILLGQVFGVPGLFCAGPAGNACTAINASLPLPFHLALQNLFKFYSMGLLLVGALIFLYYVIVVVAETAISGSPFGQRFKNIWVPIRLVVALGLLIPLNHGYNSAQYIVLHAAKYGSGFATNAWHTFNKTIESKNGRNPLGENASLLALPMGPDMAPLVQFMSMVHKCEYMYWKQYPPGTQTPTEPLNPQVPTTIATSPKIQPYFIKSPKPAQGNQLEYLLVTPSTTYQQALDFYNKDDVVIRFGERDSTKYKTHAGNVQPFCGDIRIKIGDRLNLNRGLTVGGADYMQQIYFHLVKEMWFGTWGGPDPVPPGNPGSNLRAFSYKFIEVGDGTENVNGTGVAWQCHPWLNSDLLNTNPECVTARPDSKAKQKLITDYNSFIDSHIVLAWNLYNQQGGVNTDMKNPIRDRGWAGAGIWYNIIAQINGAFSNSINQIPTPDSQPMVMEATREQRMAEDTNVASGEIYTPKISGGRSISVDGDTNALLKATRLAEAFEYWTADNLNQDAKGKTVTGELFRDFISFLFQAKGLFSMNGYNAHIHPLAQLTSLGKSLVDSAIFSLAASAATSGFAPLLKVIEPNNISGVFAEFFASLWSTVGLMALIAGVTLYYILPFLPFLYFFFAVGTWIMSIFEAMVGAPLWALAHLRIDGEGLPGEAASNGYYLIFEIFLRPILSVFGLVAALVIFAAQVRALNLIWGLVLGNLTGNAGFAAVAGSAIAPRDIVDQFAFSIVYIIITYMLAIASFKLIDRIPDNILKFMGPGVSSFSDINPDATEGLSRYVAQGGLIMGQKATDGISKASSGLGGVLAQEISPPPRPGKQ
jgi:hypothetical protein